MKANEVKVRYKVKAPSRSSINFSAARISVPQALLLSTVMFPFVGPFTGIDVQPTFIIACSIVGIILFLRIRLSWTAFGVSAFCFVPIVLRILFDVNAMDARYVATYLVVMLTPFLMWGAITQGALPLASRAILVVAGIYTGVAIVQAVWYEGFLAEVVSRESTAIQNLVASGRGVRSLTGEPSHFGKLLVVLNVLFALFTFRERGGDKRVSVRIVKWSVLFFLSNILLAQSFYFVTMHAFVLLLLFYVLGFGLLATYGTAAVALFVGASRYFLENARFNLILSALSNDVELLLNQGAFARVMNVPISLYGGILANFVGFGNSDDASIGRFDLFGYIYEFVVSSRNVGGFVELWLRFGVFSLPFFVVYFYVLSKIWTGSYTASGAVRGLGAFAAFSAFVLSFLDGSVTNPLVWYLLISMLLVRRSIGDPTLRAESSGLQGMAQ